MIVHSQGGEGDFARFEAEALLSLRGSLLTKLPAEVDWWDRIRAECLTVNCTCRAGFVSRGRVISDYSTVTTLCITQIPNLQSPFGRWRVTLTESILRSTEEVKAKLH